MINMKTNESLFSLLRDTRRAMKGRHARNREAAACAARGHVVMLLKSPLSDLLIGLAVLGIVLKGG